MTKVITEFTISLDGFIAGPDDDIERLRYIYRHALSAPNAFAAGAAPSVDYGLSAGGWSNGLMLGRNMS
jgi:hypothetical protein